VLVIPFIIALTIFTRNLGSAIGVDTHAEVIGGVSLFFLAGLTLSLVSPLFISGPVLSKFPLLLLV
jgi:hypothetical protein